MHSAGVFCSGICHDNGRVLEVLDNVPPSDVMEYVANARRAPCTTCGKAGPVDVWSSFRARSVVVYTSWNTVKKIECRSCARKRQWGDLSYSLVAGWWGVPWLAEPEPRVSPEIQQIVAELPSEVKQMLAEVFGEKTSD
jgi:hypothetical protein